MASQPSSLNARFSTPDFIIMGILLAINKMSIPSHAFHNPISKSGIKDVGFLLVGFA